MRETELLGSLQTLRQLLDEMKALLAWQKLKTHEIRQRTSSFIGFSNTGHRDLTDKYSSFLSLARQIHQVLDASNTKLTNSQYKRINKQLVTIETQARFLGSPIKVY